MATVSEERCREWVEPLGMAMSFTSHILTIAGDCGVPIVGVLRIALAFGSNVLDPETSLEDGFNEVFQELQIIQNQIDDLQKTVKKNLFITADIKWEEGLKRVKAFCKDIYAKKSLLSIISYLDKSGAFFFEIRNDATQHFDEDKLEEYMDFLTEEKGIQECINFYNYVLALRSQFLSILVLYHSFKDEIDEVMLRYINRRVSLWPVFIPKLFGKIST